MIESSLLKYSEKSSDFIGSIKLHKFYSYLNFCPPPPKYTSKMTLSKSKYPINLICKRLKHVPDENEIIPQSNLLRKYLHNKIEPSIMMWFKCINLFMLLTSSPSNIYFYLILPTYFVF